MVLWERLMSKKDKKYWNGRTPDKGGGISYYSDGENWWRKTAAIRCTEEVFMHGQCQGVEGHDDVHWCYSECGSFCWDDNEYDPKEGGCSGSTPPDHEKYRSPQDMQKHYHANHGSEWEKIEDVDLIAKLEADEIVGENISVSRPVTSPKALARLKEIQEENDAAAEKFMKGKPRPTDVS